MEGKNWGNPNQTECETLAASPTTTVNKPVNKPVHIAFDNKHCVQTLEINVDSDATLQNYYINVPLSAAPTGTISQVSPCLTMSSLTHLAESYTAGNITTALLQWVKLTTDKHIISIVKYGLPLQFTSIPAPQPPYTYNLSVRDSTMVSNEVANLLKKGAITPTTIDAGDYFSPVFPRINKDGTPRLLLNLKRLNEHIEYLHFKMESFQCVINMLTPNCWMASVDLKSAFYSVPIHPNHQKYL